MKSFGAAIDTLLNRRGGVNSRIFLYLTVKDLTTGLPEEVGFWNGGGNRSFVVNGETRNYIGAGSLLSMDILEQSKGLFVRQTGIRLGKCNADVEAVIRGYNVRFAPAEVHQIFFDPETNNQTGDPQRVVKGWLNVIDMKTATKNSPGEVKLTLVGNSRLLTVLIPSKKSDQNQRLRSATDAFFKYVTPTGTIHTPWGTE